MRRRWAVLFAVAAILVAAPRLRAHEPDGRVALRYEWTAVGSGGTRPLRVALTAIVALRDVRVSATVPAKTSVAIRALRIAGQPSPPPPDSGWPDAGLTIGALASGQTIVFDLDVVEPPQGGGVLAIALDGLDGERVVHEGVGIAVGSPGVAPTLRNGALEFPAEQGERAP